jgi:transketolase
MTVSVAQRLDQLCINTIRFLAVDAVEKAQSGHPGAPMGIGPAAYVLWDRFLKHNPRNPDWPDRDRFVLSAGHGSMLLYALLHLTGYDLSLDDIQQFRQWDSKTPGHPECGRAPGVEVTTGPLGQGFGHGVGMAIAERWLACQFNRPGHEVINHYTYAICSDGDLEEGVSSEAASIAGTLRLGKLIYLYDDNSVSIEGATSITFTENVGARFAAYGWQVLGPVDGNDLVAVDGAIRQAQADGERPSLIICKTIIGYGSPEQGTGKVHGEPLGPDNARAAKEALGWPLEPAFYEPAEALDHMRKAIVRGQAAEQEWRERMQAYAAAYPAVAAQLDAQLRGDLPAGWDEGLDHLFPPGTQPLATRSASNKVINYIAPRVPALIGGAADLAPSTRTIMEGFGDQQADDHCGRNMHFGVREHSMGAIIGGMARHGGAIPYGATFLIFSDYMRPPMRLAAMMEVRAIYVFTHDSIGLGEDGPTHQPIEQLMGLRAIPNLTLIRPADATETAEAWRVALRNATGPTALALTRQQVPVLDRSKYAPAAGVGRGGYTLWQAREGAPQAIIIGTGSEVHIALEAGHKLAGKGINVRVVSLPSWRLFDLQPADYRESVLPTPVRARVSVEAGAKLGWEHYLGCDGIAIGLDHYGASAPYKAIYEHFGITPEKVIEAANTVLGRLR